MAAALRPVRGKAGTFVVPQTGKVIKLVEWREDNLYDTVNLQSGTTSTAAGTELLYFDSLANKKKRDTNLNKAHAIPAGWEMVITRIGFYFHLTTGNTEATPADAKKVYEGASILSQINETVIADGWVLGYQIGIGMAGQTNETGQGVISPGVASIGAAPVLLVPQEVNDGHDIRATLRFDNNSWTTTSFTQPSLSVGATAKHIFRGFIKRPLSKN